jgi:hypothetical protein
MSELYLPDEVKTLVPRSVHWYDAAGWLSTGVETAIAARRPFFGLYAHRNFFG